MGLFNDALAGQDPKSLKAAADRKNLGISGSPMIPTLSSPLTSGGTMNSVYNANQGAMVNPALLNTGALSANQDALNKLKQYAMSDGASPWLNSQLQAQGLKELSAMDAAGGQANSAGALARSSLAMKGGLSAGAAERIAGNQGSSLLAARQAIGRAGEAERLGLNIADQQTKMQTLSQIPGMDINFANQRADLDKFNSSQYLDASKFNSSQAQQNNQFNQANELAALDARNKDRLDIFKIQMQGYGADQTAQATKKGGKK